ncbi:MAG: 4'-phosphopantetheinyl transferase superfamily protein [Chitinophagales bacterium]|nr:4'-phosphopantetheinyl transferase superfamily protein [Chitinophagales bacterium]
MKIYLLHIDKFLSRSEITEYILSWSDIQKNKVLEFLQAKDFNASFFGRILLIYALKELGISISLEQLNYTEKGKPYFSNLSIDFNISHSGDYVALVLGKGKYGIDIEKHRKINISLFKRQFTDKEIDTIENSSNSLVEFFRLWTIKEAAIKADGRGIEILSKVSIFSPTELDIEGDLWQYQSFNDIENYSYSVCSEQSICIKIEDIQRLNSTMLLKML